MLGLVGEMGPQRRDFAGIQPIRILEITVVAKIEEGQMKIGVPLSIGPPVVALSGPCPS